MIYCHASDSCALSRRQIGCITGVTAVALTMIATGILSMYALSYPGALGSLNALSALTPGGAFGLCATGVVALIIECVVIEIRRLRSTRIDPQPLPPPPPPPLPPSTVTDFRLNTTSVELPFEILCYILGFLDAPSRRACRAVNNHWKTIADDRQVVESVLLKTLRIFDESYWRTSFINRREALPIVSKMTFIEPLPEEFLKDSLLEPCPIFGPGYRVVETHDLVLVPGGVPWSDFNDIHSGNPLFPGDPYQSSLELVISETRWILVTKDLVPGSACCTNEDEVRATLGELSGYRLLTTAENHALCCFEQIFPFPFLRDRFTTPCMECHIERDYSGDKRRVRAVLEICGNEHGARATIDGQYFTDYGFNGFRVCREVQFSPIKKLPLDIWCHIFGFLDAPSLRACRSVSKQWKWIANENQVVERVYWERMEEEHLRICDEAWWNEMYGEKFDEGPIAFAQLPSLEDLKTTLLAPCPILGSDYKVFQTHDLVVVPGGLSFRMWRYLHSFHTWARQSVHAEFDFKMSVSSWMLVTKNVVPGSACSNEKELQGVLERYEDYRLLSVMENQAMCCVYFDNMRDQVHSRSAQTARDRIGLPCNDPVPDDRNSYGAKHRWLIKIQGVGSGINPYLVCNEFSRYPCNEFRLCREITFS